jgi:hypothetical protein
MTTQEAIQVILDDIEENEDEFYCHSDNHCTICAKTREAVAVLKKSLLSDANVHGSAEHK